MTTEHKKNKKGEWFLPKFKHVGYVGVEDYKIGLKLFEAFKGGELKAAQDDTTQPVTTGDEDEAF
jgi:hypothetical protein